MCLSQKPMRGPFLSNGPLVMGPVADSEEALEVLGQRHADHGSAGLANLARLRRAGPPACQRSCFRLPGEAGHVDAGGVRATLAVQLYWNGDEPMTLGFADGDLRGKLVPRGDARAGLRVQPCRSPAKCAGTQRLKPEIKRGGPLRRSIPAVYETAHASGPWRGKDSPFSSSVAP